jgi:hypothetical protein
MTNILYIIKKINLFWRYRNNLERARAVDKMLKFVTFTKVEGDYFEFGVYAGETFCYAYHSAQLRKKSEMQFFAFDSFEGFSAVSEDDDTGVLTEGERSFSLENFNAKLKKEKMNMSKVQVIPGWLDDTLVGSAKESTDRVVGDSKVAIAYLDVDLYEPTKVALDYIFDKLVDGTILCFDNWFLLKGHPQRGERKAFSEWQTEHPELLITKYGSCGCLGMMFIVNK